MADNGFRAYECLARIARMEEQEPEDFYPEEDDLDSAWLCACGNFETSGYCCSCCGAEPPWGCDCGAHDEDYDEEYENDWMEIFP